MKQYLFDVMRILLVLLITLWMISPMLLLIATAMPGRYGNEYNFNWLLLILITFSTGLPMFDCIPNNPYNKEGNDV